MPEEADPEAPILDATYPSFQPDTPGEQPDVPPPDDVDRVEFGSHDELLEGQLGSKTEVPHRPDLPGRESLTPQLSSQLSAPLSAQRAGSAVSLLHDSEAQDTQMIANPVIAPRMAMPKCALQK